MFTRSTVILLLFVKVSSVTAAYGTDYHDAIAFTGPCARELAKLVEWGEPAEARDRAKHICESRAEVPCPDVWIIYAYAELKVDSPTALATARSVTQKHPDSAAAHLVHALIAAHELSTAGIFRALSLLKEMKRELDAAIACDPDCHPAREGLVIIGSLPGILGGSVEELKLHLAELDARSPYYAALSRGELAALREDHVKAAEYFLNATQLSPPDNEADVLYVRTLAILGSTDEAIELCQNLKPMHSSDGTADSLFVEVAARGGKHQAEALQVSRRFLGEAKGVSASGRAEVMINTSILLKQLGQMSDSKAMMESAESVKRGAKKAFKRMEKAYQMNRDQWLSQKR